MRRNDREGTAERILKIGRDCAAHIKEPFKTMNPDELLYDEKGLPK
jgi:antitoxin VapB